MVVFNNPGYYHALDRTFTPEEQGPQQPIILEDGSEWQSKLGPKEIGTSANPMQNQVQALTAKIREGASRVELEFPGQGKGSSQSPTPESYGSIERREMRELARANNIQTTTHATFSRQGFTGLTQNGFNDAERYNNLKEIKKAIEFAAEATTGGAVVFHTGEWQRPISEKWGKGDDKNNLDADFQAYEEEGKKATFYMVDERTGQFVSAITKDKELFRPKYKTAKDLAKDKIGKYDKKKNDILEPDDYVDIKGEYIDETHPKRAFERVPIWNKENTNFEVESYNWDRIVEDTNKWNQKHPNDKKTPAEMFVRIEVENQILQAKGSSLYYANSYEDNSYQRDKIKKALDFYKRLDENLPEDEKWKLMTERGIRIPYATPDSEPIPVQLERKLKEVNDQLRYIHETSASADATAREKEELLKKIKPVEVVGLERSTDGISRAGLFAYEQSEKHKKDLKNKIYVAPENWQTEMYGSHPDELIKLVKGARQKMANELIRKRGKNAEEAKKIAKDHIKSTIDIGHLNLWRKHFVSKNGESEEARNKRFNKWAVAKTKEMIKSGIIGHVHIADNFGWDDEHLSPGEGNAPIREFVKEMEKAGIKDFIVEPGSFNPTTALPRAWRHFGSPIYAAGTPSAVPFGQVFQGHFGYSGPSNYIVGAYSPSNEWKLWSEVPME